MLHNVASDLDLHCLPLIQQFLDTSMVSHLDFFFLNFKTGTVSGLDVRIHWVNMVTHPFILLFKFRKSHFQ